MTDETDIRGAHAAIADAAAALHRAGVIDKTTMREFAALAVAPVPEMPPAEIKAIRESARVSQPVFARYLGTSESTVEKWETGAKRPSGMARRLLSVVQRRGIEALT